MEIIKRTGQKETFRSEKIADAIAAAFKSVGTEVSAVKALTAEITEELKRLYETERRIHIETIQDLVEKTLIKHNYPAEVKSFILYRESRAKKRSARQRITDTFSSLDLDGELKSVQKEESVLFELEGDQLRLTAADMANRMSTELYGISDFQL